MANPASLLPGKTYHVYSRGNNREDIFREARNYRHFMKLYAYHVAPVADTFAYCLLRNHFHLLVRIKREETRLDPSRRFANLLNAYSKAFNRAYGRTGALFQRPFGRIEVDTDAYFHQLVIYVHRNPQRHGLIPDFREWPYSSYHALLSARATRLRRDETLAWFDGRESFVRMHGEDELADGVSIFAPDDFD